MGIEDLLRKNILVSLLLLSVFSLSSAHAETKRACARTANTTHNLCVSDCNQDHVDSLLICSASDDTTLQQCFQGCATDRDNCLKPFQNNSRTCFDACFTVYDTASTACEQNECNQGSLQCQICKLTAKLNRFQCGVICKNNFEDTKDARKTCRKTFSTCVKNCRKTSTSNKN